MKLPYLMIPLELLGSLGLFLYGMKVLSDALQRAAGENLKRALGFMTRNNLSAVMTGLVITAVIQSSSATTVMVVTFVNAGLLSLVQATGVIMGANIGTTVTAWIVSLVGFKFDIVAFAIPCVGVGFLMAALAKGKEKVRDYGEALLGFGLLFLGLKYLSKAIPDPSPEALHFLEGLAGHGFVSTLAFVLVGTLLTVLVHSSSASTAIVITLAVQGVIGFEMAAALVLGCNIGTTIDALLASIGTKLVARRAAIVHVLFNVAGSVWAVLAFKPFLGLVDLLVPGTPDGEIATHIAMLHTVFNVINVVVLFPFIRPFTRLVESLVRAKAGEEAAELAASYAPPALLALPELNLVAARKDVSDLAGLARDMFSRFRNDLKSAPGDIEAEVAWFRERETLADEYQEGLATFLLEVTRHNASEGAQADVHRLLRVVDDLESVTDSCLSLAYLLERCRRKGLVLDQEELESLAPYTLIAEEFLRFVVDHSGGGIDAGQLEIANRLEEKLDEFRAALKKKARKKIKAGADVKTELLFIDMVRHIEKIGDYSWSISEALREMR